MYSAVKKDGKRLYELAREGKDVEREPRAVTIHGIELLEFGAPDFRIRVRCSKGTYIRTLAHDLGEALGFGGHLRALRRIQSGPFTLAQAVTLKDVVERREEAAKRIISLADAFAELPTVVLDAATLSKKLAHGQPLEVPSAVPIAEGARVRVLGPDGAMVALCERKGPQLRYLRVLAGA
jgi:tRNA pseudouridine55 synthase